MLPLTDFDKLLIVVAAVFLVLVTALITACKTCPGCYLYYYCPLRRYFDERESNEMNNNRRLAIACNVIINSGRQKQEYQQILYYGPPYIPSVKQTSNGSYQTDKERKASLQATYPTPVLPALESKNLFASQLPPPYTSICTSREVKSLNLFAQNLA